MVTITNAFQKEGEKGPFVLLELQSELEMVQSQNTLKFYLTARKCTIASTLDLQTAKACIGKGVPGRIAKVPCAASEFTVPETGEVITLSHYWEYLPEPTPLRVVHASLQTS